MLETFHATMREALSEAKAGAARSPRIRNMIIGAGRTLDPVPHVDQTHVEFILHTMIFTNGFARDRANLATDRLASERKNRKAIQIAYGKTAICA